MQSSRERPPEYALAIETSGAVGSIALGEGHQILATRVFSRPRAHAIEFFPAIDELCRQAGVSPSAVRHVYVSSGPGSFTGLRIGITAARTIAFATGAKVVAVPTLEVIAQNATGADPVPERVAVLLDAKRGHVYAAMFRRVQRTDPDGETHSPSPIEGQPCGFDAETEPVEADPATFLAASGRGCAVLGEGVLYHRPAVAASGLRVLDEKTYRPRAEVVYALGRAKAARGEFSEPRDLIPIYIRPPEAEEKWAAKNPQSGHRPDTSAKASDR